MKIKSFFSLMLFVLIISCTIAGCKADEDDSQDKFPLAGNWKLAGTGGDPIRITFQFIEKNHSFIRIDSNYDETDTTIHLFDSQTEGTYVIGEKIDISDSNGIVKTVRALDLTIDSAIITPTSQNGVATLNGISFLTFSDWSLNVPKDVAGIDYIDPIGAILYDIVYIDGDNLYLGDSNSGDKKTEATRPTQLETTHYFRTDK